MQNLTVSTSEFNNDNQKLIQFDVNNNDLVSNFGFFSIVINKLLIIYIYCIILLILIQYVKINFN